MLACFRTAEQVSIRLLLDVTERRQSLKTVYGSMRAVDNGDRPDNIMTVHTMNGSTLHPPTVERDGGLHPDLLERVLKSQTFEKAPALRALLAYLWRNRELPLSEYAIATEALGRSPSFDARTDATVRVQVSRLRQRLERFYEKENTFGTDRLVIPIGTHQITLDHRAPATTLTIAEAAVVDPPVTVQSRSVRKFWLVVGMALGMICVTQTILLYRITRSKAQPVRPEISRVWQDFFGNGRPTRIALPTPTFFAFHRSDSLGNPSLMFRDTEVNDFAERSHSASYRRVEQLFGPPSLAENYTVTSDTFAAVRLARYLDHAGLQTSVVSSADGSLEALDKENLIAVGTWGTLSPLKPFLDEMNYHLGPHETSVDSRHPAAGEFARIDGITESPERGIWPGVIAFLPGNGGQTHLLILASRHTSALVSFLTSTNGLEQLEKLWKSKKSPEYFEVVVNAELSGRGVVRTWPVALHQYVKATK